MIYYTSDDTETVAAAVQRNGYAVVSGTRPGVLTYIKDVIRLLRAEEIFATESECEIGGEWRYVVYDDARFPSQADVVRAIR